MRKAFLKGLALFLVAFGVPCVLFPFAYLFMAPGSALMLDTRAYLGGGDTASSSIVSTVNCSAEEYGAGLRAQRMRLWTCILTLGNKAQAAPPTQPGDPYAGMSRAEAMEAYQRQLSGLAKPNISAHSAPSSLVRELPSDRTGELPELRLMSVDGEAAVYAVVWGGADILQRWLFWVLMALLMLAFGGACLYAASVAWRRR